MTANTTTAPVAQTAPAISVSTIYQMTEDELKALLRVVKDRLRLAHLASPDNLNVVSVRLAFDTCDQVRQIASTRRRTLSEVVRDAITAYCEKETTR